jgi:hypothetical protein
VPLCSFVFFVVVCLFVFVCFCFACLTRRTSLDLKTWTPYKAPSNIGMSSVAEQSGVFAGNRDTDSLAPTVLLAPPVARAVRMRPVTTHRRHAMRLEILVMPLGRAVGIEVS